MLLFTAFAFAWLFWFQADILATVQHALSNGQTHYNRTVGALIITAVLLLVHFITFAATRLARRTHALTYLPSMLLLAFISSIGTPFTWGAWLWAAPLILILWSGAVWLARQMLPMGDEGRLTAGFLSRQMWINIAQMCVMMLCVAAVSNTNAVEHYKARMERELTEGDAAKALSIGSRSLETDESLTMLRIFALSSEGQLAERLFDYAISGTSADMLPMAGSRSRLTMMPDSLLWQHFGVSPDSIAARADSTTGSARHALSVSQYLDSLATDTLATAAHRDYRLMGMLIDRSIDTFVVTLPRYYALAADSLPRHYREALVLYQQTRDTMFAYEDTLMLRRWHTFLQYDSIYIKPTERKIRTEGEYRGTYWYYFY